jgi:hypothetical protein
MHAKRLLYAFLVLALTSLLAMPATTLAQSTEFPIVPDPAECQVEPRSPESLAAIAGTPEPELDAATEAELPQGPAADAEIFDAIVAAERLLVACYNAGDNSRLLSLLTDRAILLASGGTPSQEMIDILLSPATPEATESRTSLVQVRDVRVLGPDRIGSVAEWGLSSDPGVITEINFHVFVKVGDRWLLDAEVAGLPLPTAATPAT